MKKEEDEERNVQEEEGQTMFIRRNYTKYKKRQKKLQEKKVKQDSNKTYTAKNEQTQLILYN